MAGSFDPPFAKRAKTEDAGGDENVSHVQRPTTLFSNLSGMGPPRGFGNTPGFPPMSSFQAETPSTNLVEFGVLGNQTTFLTPVANGPMPVTPSIPPQSSDIQNL